MKYVVATPFECNLTNFWQTEVPIVGIIKGAQQRGSTKRLNKEAQQKGSTKRLNKGAQIHARHEQGDQIRKFNRLMNVFNFVDFSPTQFLNQGL